MASWEKTAKYVGKIFQIILNKKFRIYLFLTQSANICSTFPCLNDGECLSTDGFNYKCKCKKGYNGFICEKGFLTLNVSKYL